MAIMASSVLLKPHPFDSPLLSILRVIIVCFASVLLTRYTVYMFLSPWYSVIAKREKALLDHFVHDYQPLVSVMIPAWNESVGLTATIKTLLASTYKHLELVVVNDGSTDDSDFKMHKFLADYEREMAGIPRSERIEIVYRYQTNAGKGAALNTAISIARGDILISIDADCIVHERAVEHFVETFRDPRTQAAVGNVRIANTKGLIGTLQYLEYILGFGFKRADSLLNSIYIVGGAAGAFRKKVFEQLGGYDCKNITEDIELSTRIQKAGMKITYCPDALIYTEGANTLNGLMKQRLRWKRGRLQTFWKHRDLFFSLQPHHNKVLSWLILPLAVFQDVQIGFEPSFLLALYLFSFFSGDFSAFLSGVIIVFVMFLVQFWEKRTEYGYEFLVLSPIAWCLFYILTFVEFYALIMSIWLLIRRKEARWQKWARKGVNGQ